MTNDELRAWLQVREPTGKPASAGNDQDDGDYVFTPQDLPSDGSHDIKAWMARETPNADAAQDTRNLNGAEGAEDDSGTQEAHSRHSSVSLSEKEWSATFSLAAKTAFIWQGMQKGMSPVEMQEQWNQKSMNELEANPKLGFGPFLLETTEKENACSSQVTDVLFFLTSPTKIQHVCRML